MRSKRTTALVAPPHMTADGATNWYEFILAILEQAAPRAKAFFEKLRNLKHRPALKYYCIRPVPRNR
jgi:hypothetical protein